MAQIRAREVRVASIRDVQDRLDEARLGQVDTSKNLVISAMI
jgi:hypothetical protein